MLFDISYMNYIFPFASVLDEFDAIYSYSYPIGEPKTFKDYCQKYSVDDTRRISDYFIKGYLEYTLDYCLVNDIYDYSTFFKAVKNSYFKIYDESVGLYPTIEFESIEMADDFYRSFFKTLKPIYEFYVDNADMDKMREVSFSNKYKELYGVYSQYGEKGKKTNEELYEFFFSHLRKIKEDFERPSKNEVFN